MIALKFSSVTKIVVRLKKETASIKPSNQVAKESSIVSLSCSKKNEAELNFDCVEKFQNKMPVGNNNVTNADAQFLKFPAGPRSLFTWRQIASYSLIYTVSTRSIYFAIRLFIKVLQSLLELLKKAALAEAILLCYYA